MTYNGKYQSIARRQMLLGASAMISLGLMTSTAFANGGRDPKPPSGSSSNTTIEIGNKPRTKTRKTRVMLTQSRYHRISSKGLKTAIKGIDSGDDYWIEGFSKKMSRNIFEMTLLDRKKTLEIFKKMRTLKTKKAREDYLWEQESWLAFEINRLNEDIRPKTMAEILFDDSKEHIDKLKAKRKKLKTYLKLLRKWSKKPLEGSLPVG